MKTDIRRLLALFLSTARALRPAHNTLAPAHTGTMGTARHAIKPMFGRGKWRLLRGDTVQIMAGRDRGATGVVARVIRDDRKPAVIVEGRNLVGLSGEGYGG